MPRTFEIQTNKDPDTFMAEAKEIARENDATLTGDARSGTFSGMGVEGSYEVEGKTVRITITEKPWLLPWALVESTVRGFFG